VVEEDSAGTRRALVEGENEGHRTVE
jgi:hypothetical protein